MNQSELTSVIDKLQENADEVKKNILETEDNFNKDVANLNEGKPMVYQDSTNEAILNSLELLNNMDIDMAKVKDQQHPEAEDIMQDIKQLRDRVIRLRDEHRNLYLLQNDWSRIIDEKLVNLENKGFGQDLPTIENEVAEHEIFHIEVENLACHIGQGDQDLQLKYNTLMAKSSDRQKNLLSLRDYMRRWTIEFNWLNQQMEERITYDWSGANLDLPTLERQYEDFSERLDSKQEAIYKVKDDGEEFIDQDHPGKHVIEAHLEALRVKFLNCMSLRVCEREHLINMEDYHKFQKDVQEIQDLLEKKDIKITEIKNSKLKEPEQLESLLTDLTEQAESMADLDDRVWTLKNCSLDIVPIQYRKNPPQEELDLEALCDYETDQGQVNDDEDYTLIKNNGDKWDVKDSEGHMLTVPGVCFIIPPPDLESVAAAENLMSFYSDIMQKLLNTKKSLESSLTNMEEDETEEDDDDEENWRYAELMDLLDDVDENSTEDDSNIFQKMKSIIDNMSFGEDAETIKEELEDHTFFLKEFKNAASDIMQDEDDSGDLQMQFNDLLESLEARQKNLVSLKDFVERCDEELTMLGEEADNRIEFDWSNIDYQKQLQHHENFVTNSKGAINSKIDALLTDGRELINQDHPGQNTIQEYIDQVNKCWEVFLVVLECEEFHLKNIGHQQQISNQQKEFQDECTEINKLLKQQESKLKKMKEKVKEIKKDEDEYQLHKALTIMTDVEKNMKASHNRIKKLQELILQFAPPSDQETPSQGEQSVVALCDFDIETTKLVKGARYTLISTDYNLWDVKDSAGNDITAPALFFNVANKTVFPTDRVESLERHWKTINDQMSEIKKKLTSQRDKLREDDTGVYSEPEMMKCEVSGAKMETKNRCPLCNYIQKKFSMKDKKYKCENENCGYRQDSRKYVNMDVFIVTKVNNKNITLKIPTPVVKGYLKENDLEHLLEDTDELTDHFTEESGFEIMYDGFRRKKISLMFNFRKQ